MIGKYNFMPKKRPGQKFFAILIIFSGMMVFFLFMFIWKGREISISLFQNTVVEKAFFPLIEMPIVESLEFKKEVRDFYNDAVNGKAGDKYVLNLTVAIAESVKDNKLSDKELEDIKKILADYKTSVKDNK